MKIAVAGATGRLGQHIAAVLAERGHDVLALDVRGQPDAFAVLELSLTGGLVSVISPGLPPWPLELGKGGRTQYAMVTP